jgi:uncharacterized RmlC-like cupin family protein
VVVARGTSLAEVHSKAVLTRATAFDFIGSGGQCTWIGTVSIAPNARTGAHHHGRHEVAVYVASGRSEIRWGEKLEFATEVAEGDFVYFAPYVPHEERNLDSSQAVNFVVVRSDNERISVPLPLTPVEPPEKV